MMIPISLKVSLDLIKYCYAKFIDWVIYFFFFKIYFKKDICMYDEETNIPANATRLKYIFKFLNIYKILVLH